MSPLILPAGVAALLLLLSKKAGATTSQPTTPEPLPEPGPQTQPQPAPGTPLPPLARDGTFPVGTVTRAVNTPSGAFIHSAPNALVSSRIGRIANGSRVAVLEAGPPSPDNQGGPNTWAKISTADGAPGFIADSLLGPSIVEGGELGPTNVAGLSAGAWANPRSRMWARPAYGQARFAQPMVGSARAAALHASRAERVAALHFYPGSGTAVSATTGDAAAAPPPLPGGVGPVDDQGRPIGGAVMRSPGSDSTLPLFWRGWRHRRDLGTTGDAAAVPPPLPGGVGPVDDQGRPIGGAVMRSPGSDGSTLPLFWRGWRHRRDFGTTNVSGLSSDPRAKRRMQG